jgi:hypothetical protein
MGFLRGLSKFLMIFPVGTFLYDLTYQWFVKNRFMIRSLKEWWQEFSPDTFAAGRETMKGIFANWDKIADWHAPLVLLIPPAVLYLLYRIIFAIRGGQGGDGFKYKSRD